MLSPSLISLFKYPFSRTPTMAAEPSSPNKPTSETPQTPTTMSEFQQNKKAFDFAFILKPVKTLRIAIEALRDPKLNLNEDMDALIQVSPNGFEMSVWHVHKDTGNEAFAMLRFKSAGLQNFQCSKPLRKMLPLDSLPIALNLYERFNPDSIAIFAEEGSNQITFQCGTSNPGRRVQIELKEADDKYSNFINVSYMYESVVPSNALPDMVRMLPLGEKEVLEAEMIVGPYRIQMEWSFWVSLNSASRIADNCSVCLTRDPDKFVMLRFRLGEFGDMVILNEADFEYAPDLPIMGQFHSLHGGTA